MRNHFFRRERHSFVFHSLLRSEDSSGDETRESADTAVPLTLSKSIIFGRWRVEAEIQARISGSFAETAMDTRPHRTLDLEIRSHGIRVIGNCKSDLSNLLCKFINARNIP